MVEHAFREPCEIAPLLCWALSRTSGLSLDYVLDSPLEDTQRTYPEAEDVENDDFWREDVPRERAWKTSCLLGCGTSKANKLTAYTGVSDEKTQFPS